MVKTSVVVEYETMELAAFRVSPCAFFVVVGGFGVVGGVVVVVVVVVVVNCVHSPNFTMKS